MNRIEQSFRKLRGNPCWGVKRGYGSFLTFEFGNPRLVIRNPQSPRDPASRRIRELLKRRHIGVRGQWHLWIYCCKWVVRQDHRVIGDWSTSRRIDRAARFLNGQKLISVSLRQRGARTRFLFDLGAELETKPFDRASEQWLLYEPSGYVLSFRADRKYSYAPGNEEPEKTRWRSVAV